MTTMQIDCAVVEQALEALLTPSGAQACSTCQEGPENEYCCRMEMWSAVAALRAALAQPVPHGCHVDLEKGMKPDGCVLDEGSPNKCIYARRLLREGKDKTACEYWKPIEVQR